VNELAWRAGRLDAGSSVDGDDLLRRAIAAQDKDLVAANSLRALRKHSPLPASARTSSKRALLSMADEAYRLKVADAVNAARPQAGICLRRFAGDISQERKTASRRSLSEIRSGCFD
jgi:hypothetical protein